MALRVRYQYRSGSTTIQYSIERLADGSIYDFGSSAFVASGPTTQWQALPESTTWPGIYSATLATAGWQDDDYAIYVRDTSLGTAAIACLGAEVVAGDDFVPPSEASVSSTTIGEIVAAIFAQPVDGQAFGSILSYLLAGFGAVPTVSTSGGITTIVWPAAGSPGTPRVTATEDASGNPLSVALNPPAS